MKRVLAATASLLLTPSAALAQRSPDLHIYFADADGGQATLFVAPTGESLLVDTGWEDRPGMPPGEDADRILALCRQAGVGKIDTVLITHFHEDHVGGVPALLDRIPVGQVVDHGPNREARSAESGPATLAVYAAYTRALGRHRIPHLVAHPGDHPAIPGFDLTIVSGDGQTLTTPLPRAGAPNPACAASPEKPLEDTENDRSLGFVLTFGKARILDVGDLTWNRERPLVCPNNLLGPIDLFVVSHHGFDHSNSPAFLAAIHARVSVMDNGARKGATSSAWQIVHDHSGELWQLHTAEGPGARNVADDHIANLAGTPDHGWPLLVTVSAAGAVSVQNPRTGSPSRAAPGTTAR